MKLKTKILSVLALLIAGFVYYYVSLPAVNIHSVDIWYFIIFGEAFERGGRKIYERYRRTFF